jgi:Helix-turn-helix domain
MNELTTSQAVRAYKTHPNVLIRLILLGRLKARKNADGRWLINRESLERWNRQRVRRTPKPEQAAIAVGAGA